MTIKARYGSLIWGIPVTLALLTAIAGYLWFERMPSRPVPGPVDRIIVADRAQPVGALVYVAYTQGYFAQEGLEVVLESYASGKAALESVLHGKSDMATSAETSIVLASMTGQDISVVATLCTASRNTIIIARKDKGIIAPKNLIGKKIGVTFGTNGQFFLDLFLADQRVRNAQVHQVDLKPDMMFDRLMSGDVDAVSIWNPHARRLQKNLGDNAVTFDGGGIYTETDNLVARNAFIRQKPEAVKKMLRALIRAERFIAQKPGTARRIIASRIGMEPTQLNDAWPGIYYRVVLQQSLLVLMEDQARWAIRNRYVERQTIPNYLNFIYRDALDAVNPGAVSIIR